MKKPPVDPVTLARARKLRRTMTHAERKLWNALRKKQLYGLRFRRQHPVPPYIADFYCHAHRLIVEVDGGQHFEPRQKAHDQARTAFLQQQGLRVIRFTNHEVETNLEGVLEAIAAECALPLLLPPYGGELKGGGLRSLP